MFGIPRNQIPSNVLFAAAQPGTVTVKGIYLEDVSNVVVDGFVVDVQYTVEVGIGFGGDRGRTTGFKTPKSGTRSRWASWAMLPIAN